MELPGGNVFPFTSASGVIAAEPPAPDTGSNPFATNCGAKTESDSWLIPVNTSGVAIGAICWPSKGISGEPAETGARSETDETVGFGRFGFQSVPASCANETGRGSFGVKFSEPLLKRSTICLMGVIPAIGSRENGKLNAMAPTILPSI